MGIQGLLDMLDPIQEDINIKQYSGKRVAIDGRAWLYRGAFGSAFELCMNLNTNKYVEYFIQMVQTLLLFNVIPIIVFEGQALPLKGENKIQQLLQKKKHLHEGFFHAEEGNVKEAKKSFQKGFSIDEQMINNVIKALDAIHVQHVVAPYDVGPQLLYMLKKNQVETIITEDSELLAFGCDNLIFKLDRQGNGKRIKFDDILNIQELKTKQYTSEMFRYMCITAGCSFLSSISVAGINRARELVYRNPTKDKLFKALRARFSTMITEPYTKGFQQADAAFLYQFVYDVDTGCYERLNPFPKDLKVSSFYLLGQNPQGRHISVLRSNNAVRFPKFDSNEIQKKYNAYLETETENLDEIEFKSNSDSDDSSQTLVKQEFVPKIAPRPILKPKPIRRSVPTKISKPLEKIYSQSNTPDIKETPKDENNRSRSCKFDIPNTSLKRANVYPIITTRTLKAIKSRPPKRKLLTLDDALPPNKITKIDEEDPFGINLL